MRSEIPIWIAALGEERPADAELADGWMPHLFIPERAERSGAIRWRAGAAERDPSLGGLMITAGGLVAIGEGEEVAKRATWPGR